MYIRENLISLNHECTEWNSKLISSLLQTCFIPKNDLYEAFEKFCPHIEYRMWLKLGLSITAKKIREHLSYEVRGAYVKLSFSLNENELKYC